MKQSSFSTNFRIAEPSNLNYVIHFCKPKKGLSSPVFTIEILVAETLSCYQIIKVVPSNLPRAIECATMPSVSNVTKEMFWKNMCAFFMKLFASKDKCIFLWLSTNQNWP